jgi:hypothetical protein
MHFKMYVSSPLLNTTAWNFLCCSAYLGNLFATIGNAELSNKMMSYTLDQPVFVIQNLLFFWWFLYA